MFKSAQIDPTGTYRYSLVRDWSPSVKESRSATFIMLNPSTADAAEDDPTIRRCINFAKSWECNGILVVNLFAFRSPSPKVLLEAVGQAHDITGPDNVAAVKAALKNPLCVAAWGAHHIVQFLDPMIVHILSTAHLQCLGKTKDGSPRHPLYVKATQPLEPFHDGRG